MPDSEHQEISEMLDAYAKEDQERVRLLAEEVLAKLAPTILQRLKALTKSAEEPAGRPCHGRCDTAEDAAACSRWSNEIRKGIPEKLFKTLTAESGQLGSALVAAFFMIHGSAYERWEESYDYDQVGCTLSLGRQLAEVISEKSSDAVLRMILRALSSLSTAVHHSALIENGMMANDPRAMGSHANKRLDMYRSQMTCLQALPVESAFLYMVKGKLEGSASAVPCHNQALVKVAELMSLRQANMDAFISRYASERDEVVAAIKSLESMQRFEAASEMRGHLCTLDRFASVDDKATLRLCDVSGELSFAFFLEPEGLRFDESGTRRTVEAIADDIFGKEQKPSLSRYYERVLRHIQVGTSVDTLPDILETEVCREHFENVLIRFDDVTVWTLPLDGEDCAGEIITLSPRLVYHKLGIGCVTFLLKDPPVELTVPQFQVLKNLASPHSAQYRIHWAEEPGRHVWPRLGDLAEDIANAFCREICKKADCRDSKGERLHLSDLQEQERLASAGTTRSGTAGLSQHCGHVSPDETWMCSFCFYRVSSSGGRTLGSEEIKKHWEWPGIVAYPRADRASVDDWVGISVPELELKNLAGIRGHTGDVFILSSNHSITYLPDDPYFVVFQYLLTARWTLLLRSYVTHCLSESNRVLRSLDERLSSVHARLARSSRMILPGDLDGFSEQIRERQIETHRYYLKALSAIDHVTAVGVSRYSDHARLLRRAFEHIGMPELLSSLTDKVQGLAASQQAAASVIDRIKEERQRWLETLLKIATVLGGIALIDQILKKAGQEGNLRLWLACQIPATTLLVSVLVFLQHPRLPQRLIAKMSGLVEKIRGNL